MTGHYHQEYVPGCYRCDPPMTPETPAGSAPGFTPGPWTIGDPSLKGWAAANLAVLGSDGHRVAWCETNHQSNDPLRYERPMWADAANARLIAQAPALYALAARLVVWYDTHCDPAQPMDEHAACELRALVDEARGVVATGEERP